MKYALSIGSRYLALIIQFILVLTITNALPQSDTGLYFATFGVITTLYALTGLGIPDGLVKMLGHDIAKSMIGTVRATVIRSMGLCALSGAGIVALGITLGMLMDLDLQFLLLAGLWYFLVSMNFVVSQALVTLRWEAAGSFFFYSAINIFILLTSVPYLLLAAEPTLNGLLAFSNAAAGGSLTFGFLILLRRLAAFPGTERAAAMGPAMSTGWIIAISRMLQSMVYWVPVWVTTIWLSTADAAVIGAAGRLLIAVSAVIAALRFSVRPTIVAAAAKDDWHAIETVGRRISLGTFIFTLCAMVVWWLLGHQILGVFFTAEYTLVWPLLMVLLVGALGEAFGGPVDEVLRMTKQGHIVLIGLLITIILETVLAVVFVPSGVVAVAWAQAAALVLMYLAMVLYLRLRCSIWVMPLPTRKPS